jgi:hypothetical protein
MVFSCSYADWGKKVGMATGEELLTMPSQRSDIMDWNCGESATGKTWVWGSSPGSVVVVVGAIVVVVVAACSPLVWRSG